MTDKIKNEILKSTDRFGLWVDFLNSNGLTAIAEVGVYKGSYAKKVLEGCPNISKYYMLDPWRNLTAWNKPANTDDEEFASFYRETLEKTELFKDKIEILRGKTTEVIDKIPENSLDFVYIDGDHTLKGISLDLINVWPKVKEGGYIGGDDFTPTIWQHDSSYEPSLVHPFAVYFAEAMNATIYILPHFQFLISKEKQGFRVINYSGTRYEPSLRSQFVIESRKDCRRILEKKHPNFFNFLKKFSLFQRNN